MTSTLSTRFVRFAPIALALAAAPASAQERVLQFELGLGVSVAPAYEGSDEYKTGPGFGAGLDALALGPFNIQPGDGLGFGFSPSFRYLAERTADDYDELQGIDDVDAALEIGAKVSYRWEQAEAFTALRRGLGGHEGLVMDFGADAIFTPSDQMEIRFGPRLSLANEAYMDTYFSVPGTAANFAQYDADGGLKSYGLEMSVRYDMSDRWSIEGTLGYDHLSGPAGDSPIVRAGDRDSGSVSVLLIRKFDWRF